QSDPRRPSGGDGAQARAAPRGLHARLRLSPGRPHDQRRRSPAQSPGSCPVCDALLSWPAGECPLGRTGVGHAVERSSVRTAVASRPSRAVVAFRGSQWLSLSPQLVTEFLDCFLNGRLALVTPKSSSIRKLALRIISLGMILHLFGSAGRLASKPTLSKE